MDQLREENEQLRHELARLRSQLAAGFQAAGGSTSALREGNSNNSSNLTNEAGSTALQQAPNGTDAHARHNPPSTNGVSALTHTPAQTPLNNTSRSCASLASDHEHRLNKDQVQRYSRHLLLASFGLQAQTQLCEGSVLIVGCGGLGSPAALYLAAAGIGRLGLVDHDTVEVSNLHRQIIHTQARVGVHKALSARESCTALNPSISVVAHLNGLTPANALELIGSYDVVVDASDNPATRYLISDACVVMGKSLVSAAAVGTDGQLTVYNHGPDGPCYRCLFPESPAPENCSRCGDAGVLGVVPGIMGSVQALEAIKILSGQGDVLSQRLLLFDALAGRFMTVKLRGKRAGCVACGESPSITSSTLAQYDYVAFTGQPASDGPDSLDLLPPQHRITAPQLYTQLSTAAATATATPAAAAASPSPCTVSDPQCPASAVTGLAAEPDSSVATGISSTTVPLGSTAVPPVLLDVRPKLQYQLLKLPGAINIPIDQFKRLSPEALRQLCGCLGAEENGSTGGHEGATHSSGSDASSSTDQAGGTAKVLRRDAAIAVSTAHVSNGTTSTGVPSNRLHVNVGSDGHACKPVSLPPVYVVCRRGNKSQIAVQQLHKAGITWAVDLIGGMTAWAESVDDSMALL